jgi:hypothetical protein
MKKIIILGLVLLMVVVFATTVCGKAQKLDLIDNSDYSNVAIQDPVGDDVGGFAILNNPDPNEEGDGCNLVVVVSLKDGEPDSDYNIYLEEWKDGVPNRCAYLIGVLHTNEDGKGNFEIRLVTQTLECLQHSGAHYIDSGSRRLQIVAGTILTPAYTQFVSTTVDITIK